MRKTLLPLILAAFAAVTVNAQAASHAGGAPMKAASAPADKASAPMKKKEKAAKKAEEKKPEMKK
jgi:hypothetical protein